MKVAKITRNDGREFMTNDTSEDSLARLKDVRSIELIEMSPEEFFLIPATNESAEFFAPIISQEK